MVCWKRLRNSLISRCRWLHNLKCGSAVPCLLGLRVRVPPVAWMSVSFWCCVLSGSGLVQKSPTKYGVSHWVWFRYFNSGASWPRVGLLRNKKKSPLLWTNSLYDTWETKENMYNVSVQYNGNITFLYFIIEFNENIHRHSRRFFFKFRKPWDS